MLYNDLQSTLRAAPRTSPTMVTAKSIGPYWDSTDNATSDNMRALVTGASGGIGGAADLTVVNRQVVHTMRLDTFMNRMGIEHVHFLKVDTQGADLDVVRSAGDRLRDIDRIQMEVTKGDQLYQGAAPTEEVLSFMADHGFKLVEREDQTFGQEENLTFVRT